MSNTRANLLLRQANMAPNNRGTRSKFPFIVVFLMSLALLITGIVKSSNKKNKNKNSSVWMWVALMSLIGLVVGIYGMWP
jgi:uncharacterized membrane protein HdeD (DUF308 family)